MRTFICTLSVLFSTFIASASAQDLSVTVVQDDEAIKKVTLAAEDLLDIDRTKVLTDNDYVTDVTLFEGPLFRSLVNEFAEDMDNVATINATALNDYSISVPIPDITDYDVIISVLMDGERMSIRDKGPFWVIYPMSRNPELQDDIFNNRLIWQLSRIEIILK